MHSVPDAKVMSAAKLFVDWSRSVDEDDFDATAQGLEAVMDILAKAEIIPLDTKERLIATIGRLNDEEDKLSLAEFFGETHATTATTGN
jgi:hypothetical protein